MEKTAWERHVDFELQYAAKNTRRSLVLSLGFTILSKPRLLFSARYVLSEHRIAPDLYERSRDALANRRRGAWTAVLQQLERDMSIPTGGAELLPWQRAMVMAYVQLRRVFGEDILEVLFGRLERRLCNPALQTAHALFAGDAEALAVLGSGVLDAED